MNPMLRILFATIVAGLLAGTLGRELGFSPVAYLAALLVVMFAISLLDRDRFYAADLRRRR